MKVLSTVLPLFFACGAMADTLRVNTFSDLNCMTQTHSFKLGELNSCHEVPERFRSLTTSEVAQSFFGRNIKVRVWSTPHCQRDAVNNQFRDYSLSNAGGNCHLPFADLNDAIHPNIPWQGLSFQLVVAP